MTLRFMHTQRSQNVVRSDLLTRMVQCSPQTMRIMTHLSPPAYQGVLGLLDRALKMDRFIATFLLDQTNQLEGLDFSPGTITDQFLGERINGTILNLSRLRTRVRQHQQRAAMLADLVRAPRPVSRRKEKHEPVSQVYDFVFRRSVLQPYHGFEIGRVENPSKLPTSISNALLTELNWLGRDRADMYAHAVSVDDLALAFKDERPVAFASVDELPFAYSQINGRRRQGQVVPLVGTAVDPSFQAQDLAVRLNYTLLAWRWLHYKFSGGWIKPFYIGVRTRNPIVVAILHKYFSGVKYVRLGLEELEARRAIAEYYKCQVKIDGVVEGAYEEAIGNTADYRGGGRLGEKVKDALEGLGPKDARIFIFRLNVFSFLKSVLKIFFKRLSK